jgi:hypothetical protein
MNDTATLVDQTGRVSVDVPTMCQMIGIGLSTGWNLLNQPDPDAPHPEDPLRPAVESITIGRRRLALVASVHFYIERKRRGRFHKVANPPAGAGRKHHRNQAVSPKRIDLAPAGLRRPREELPF